MERTMVHNGEGNQLGKNLWFCLGAMLLCCGPGDAAPVSKSTGQGTGAGKAATNSPPNHDKKRTGGSTSVQTDPAAAALAHLVIPAGDKVEKGKSTPGKAAGELILVLGDGDRKFDVLRPLSDRLGCATPAHSEKEGGGLVALRGAGAGGAAADPHLGHLLSLLEEKGVPRRSLYVGGHLHPCTGLMGHPGCSFGPKVEVV